MPILLYAHPDQHGGKGCDPPVVVYYEGDTLVMAHPDTLKAGGHTHTTDKGEVLHFQRPLEFPTESDAAACAGRFAAKMRAVDSDVVLSIDGKLLSATIRPLTAPIDYSGKVLSKVEGLNIKAEK